ncbi:hypothetical protein LTR36_004107 [Oleoguttula mirabilis]|uniref:PH domain-containing protein n=1 Tax=Oleoguttula mirabilis TaxID=1507867 RepID=A0AAV9JHS5_9PEZI|nr:hypothetical protein LTR36_004107 [Oleoguttula mirabilis]
MDPGETALESDFSPRTKYRNLPPFRDDTGNRRQRIQSLRTRPSQALENYNAEPLKDAAPHPQLQQRASMMSLFSLFSKPKVERARGYAEQGLAVPSAQTGNASSLDLLAQVRSNDASRDAPPRAASAMSFRNVTKSASTKPKAKVAAAQLAQSTRKAPWIPPPLFQAYPQSTKHGALEMSTMTVEAVLQKSKSRRIGALQLSTAETAPRERESVEDAGSMDTRRTARSTLRHVANGLTTHAELPKKIFVLVTSGYLLQYAESGPSNRLPERVLELGKDSAAFACDLVPGKHYVLQVSQAVDQQGVIIASSGSLLSKLGIRSAAAKRMTSNLLLVMPNVEEMNSWMVTIRAEIQTLGGREATHSTATRPRTRPTAESNDSFDELKEVPSRSHRYQARRDPSNISLVSKPSTETPDMLPPPPRVKDDDERSETGTMEGIELEADALAEEARSSPAKAHHDPDAQSICSSIAMSEQQHQLSSLRNSQRMSHATVATTVATSRTNSLSDSPQSEQSLKGSSETTRDSVQTKSSYRKLSSYAMGRRRSAMPLTMARERPLPDLDVPAQAQRHFTIAASAESSVTGRDSPLPMPPASPRKLAVASSEPNLRAAAAEINRAKHDSKLPSPPLSSTEECDRPLSVIGNLPSPSTLAGERSPNHRMSSCQAATAQASAQRAGSRAPGQETSEPLKPARRHSTQPFSLPLKINPSTTANRPPTREDARSSFNKVEEGSGLPVVHTLTAKVDLSPRLSASPIPSSSPPGSPKPDVPSKNPSRTPSGRLSLFPLQMPLPSAPFAPPPTAEEVLRRSPSATMLSTQSQAQSNGQRLKRPTSMQVRSDHAPFLRSVRNSTAGPPSASNNGRSFTAPIRSLKPSRPSTNMAARPRQPSPTDPFSFRAATFDSPATLPEEAADRATPLPDRGASPLPVRGASPLPVRPPSRASGGRKMKTRSSLPELDLGMDVVGLGPPAPPPQAPLPAPPMGSRPTSPMPAMPYGTTGLGIRV